MEVKVGFNKNKKQQDILQQAAIEQAEYRTMRKGKKTDHISKHIF
jgi:hypothetical protein